MNELCNTLDNFWFPSHLLDLLHHAGKLEGQNSASGNDQIVAAESLREFLLLEYATCLMTHNSLWQVIFFKHK
jgi:nuclear pore complex protein Nup85